MESLDFVYWMVDIGEFVARGSSDDIKWFGWSVHILGIALE